MSVYKFPWARSMGHLPDQGLSVTKPARDRSMATRGLAFTNRPTPQSISSVETDTPGRPLPNQGYAMAAAHCTRSRRRDASISSRAPSSTPPSGLSAVLSMNGAVANLIALAHRRGLVITDAVRRERPGAKVARSRTSGENDG